MLVFFAFLVGKVANIPRKYGSTIRTAKICLISFLGIFPVSRRGIIKNCEKISRNYESGGHSLDTIKPPFSLCVKVDFPYFIVPILHTFGTLYFRN